MDMAASRRRPRATVRAGPAASQMERTTCSRVAMLTNRCAAGTRAQLQLWRIDTAKRKAIALAMVASWREPSA
eukprot:3178903-Prymnesium_polylepis.1